MESRSDNRELDANFIRIYRNMDFFPIHNGLFLLSMVVAAN